MILPQNLPHPLLQNRQHFSFKPFIPFKPADVARAGVGEGQNAWPVGAPVDDGFGQIFLAQITEVTGVGVLADNQFQFDIVQGCQQVIVPGFGAFSARWQVAVFAFAGIAETHGYDGKVFRVIERVAVYAEPKSQAFAAGVIKGDTFMVGDLTGSLTGDEDFGFDTGLNDGARAKGQAGADLASAN